MKMLNFIFTTADALQNFIYENRIKDDHLLVLIFSDITDKDRLISLNTIIREKLPGSTIAGCSSAGLFADSMVCEDKILITFCEFEKTRLISAIYSLDNYTSGQVGEAIAHDTIREDTRLLLLFSDGLNTNASELLKGITRVSGETVVAGGLAGDNFRFQNTLVFLNDRIYESGAVGVSLNSDSLYVNNYHRLNWEKIGKIMTVTGANSNGLYEIDDTPIYDIYQRYLGPDLADNLPHSAGAEFPLIINRNGMDIARSVIAKNEDGSLKYAGDIYEGEKVRFGYGNVSLILDSLRYDLVKYKKLPSEGILVFSCAIRKTLLQAEAAKEVVFLNRKSPLAGFFTYGEFFHSKQTNNVLNATMTIVLLSEHPESNINIDYDRDIEKELAEDRQLSIIKALTCLVDSVTSELEDANRELRTKNNLLNEMVKKDGLTNLCNHKHFYECLEREVYNAKMLRKNLCVGMIDVDLFKEINDTYGHNTGDDVLKNVAECIRRSCRSFDIAGRYGGDEFAIILPETDLGEAYDILNNIRDEVRKLKYGDKNISLSISGGIACLKNEDDTTTSLVEAADTNLYQAKKRGRNQIVK